MTKEILKFDDLNFKVREDMFGITQAYADFDNSYSLSIVSGYGSESSTHPDLERTFEVAIIEKDSDGDDHVIGEPYGDVDINRVEHLLKIVSAPDFNYDDMPDIYHEDYDS